MKRRIEEVKKIVIKVGSSSLCDKDGKINKEKILMLTWQIAKLKREGYIVVLVSSGAIAAGMGALGLDSKPKTLPEKQALAAIGQARLMEIYEEIFFQKICRSYNGIIWGSCAVPIAFFCIVQN